ncbi:MAG: cyclic nucleotide-binding domain-containing protein [Gammaproteobacteria bacterium]|nr:cyclic nucleotide-binding domain-containing protein [Gammaproteobacteria bacterium]NDA14204.1 cyclic nucleotide-binding domain-containing protein [Gammaproteobacteria bacterium]NDG44813.1 cyclic nucleotide-binding domain-containing protein [Gammaproteobacteria bacterium]
MKMDFLRDAEQLREISLFARLDDSRLKLLAFASEEVTFNDGDIVFTINSASDSAYVIMSGELSVYANAQGDGEPIAMLGLNDVVGEMGVIRNQPRSATLKAHGSTRCLRILADDFLNLLKDNPDVALGVLRQMADRLALAIETVESLRREQSR